MSRLVETRRPPFYATVYATPTPEMDAGLYGEALATVVSVAILQNGFIGFEDERDADGCPVKVAYWETYGAMTAWLDKARELVPHKIGLDACLGPCGCLWPWLDEQPAVIRNAHQKVA